MIANPSSVSIAVAIAVVSVLASFPGSPQGWCCCSAFLQNRQQRPLLSIGVSDYSWSFEMAKSGAQQPGAGSPNGGTTIETPADDGDIVPSALTSLQTYVDSLSNNSEGDFTCRLLRPGTDVLSSETTQTNATITEINTIVFRPIKATIKNDPDVADDDRTYAVAIVPSSDKINVRRFSEELQSIQQHNRKNGENTIYDRWELAPSHTVEDLCGFEPGTIPPLLVPSKRDADASFGPESQRRRPLAIIVDTSLINNSVGSALLLGGGGSIRHRCLIDRDFLIGDVLEIETSNPDRPSARNAKIASILRSDGETEPSNGHSAANKLGEHGIGSSNNAHANTIEREETKPFFQIAPPAGAIGAAVVPGGAGQPPHRPVPVTAIGRLTSVRQIAKRLVFADLAPPDHRGWWNANQRAPDHTTAEHNVPDPPWRSGEDGKAMHVQIIIGKTFCDRYQDGTDRLKGLKAGKLVLVRGAANVDPMQKNGWRNSAGNWAQKRSLDVIVSSFEILDEDEGDDGLRMLVEDAQREVASRKKSSSNGNWDSLLPWERRNDYERRAVAGNNNRNGNGSPMSLSGKSDGDPSNFLTLHRFNSHFRDHPLDIQIVDDDESIEAMAGDVSGLFSRIEKDHATGNVLGCVAGIDCEWRPTGAYAEALSGGPDDNPVALLQICLPSIGKVYLVDTHRTLRTGTADTEAMTESEAILSGTIAALFGSEAVTKVGYNVAIDFRRLAASFPHVPSFRTVRSVVELSTLAERLHPKSARPWLGSLRKLTKLVLGYNITKEEQCSDWESRPLAPGQIEYAALDCALPPRLLDEMAEGSGTARMREVLPGVTKSWRFRTIDGSRKDAIRRLKAKRVVGNTFVASQSWPNSAPAPEPATIPEEGSGGGPYTDTDGLLKMPADLVGITGAGSSWRGLSGRTVEGGKKRDCIRLLVGDAVPEEAVLDYDQRSGFVAFRDGVALFVNLPDPTTPSRRRRMPYPNEWLEDGRILTWYIRKNDWDGGTSETARLLLGSSSSDGDPASPPSVVVLFARIGAGDFVCCGSCEATVAANDDDLNHSYANKKLVKLNLRLNDWEAMTKDTTAFSELLDPKKPVQSRNREFRTRLDIARAVVDGNTVGALGMALDALSVPPAERSISRGKDCAKTVLLSGSKDNDQLALRAIEILDGIII